jgi:hypothetical protein
MPANHVQGGGLRDVREVYGAAECYTSPHLSLGSQARTANRRRHRRRVIGETSIVIDSDHSSR